MQKSIHDNELLRQSLELSRGQEQLIEDFSNRLAVSSQALIKEMKEESQNFFSEKSQHIESILSPVQTTLTNFKRQLEIFETQNAEDRGTLKQQLTHLLSVEKQLEKETQTLTNILKNPGSRGRWGEIQLERILELSGMLKYCDYETQTSGDDSPARADVIVRLPKERCLIIDSKAPLSESYFSQSLDKNDLVKKLKEHIRSLKSKAYWEKYDNAPEFVILFIPGENIYKDAINLDPHLVDFASSSNVILSGPLTLLALLKTLAHIWQQENLGKQIQKISDLGKELHKRLQKVWEHMQKTGKHLHDAAKSYNSMLSSINSRVLPTIRKLETLDVSRDEISRLPNIPVEDFADAWPTNSSEDNLL
nr:DNA recombination protein RmuC [Chlamydia ibidis]